ncbi:hypothetical protein ADUPG1_013135 [Aduncisulcus paluster]|uniref:Maturase K n=1 Tax=Aduncisulcus paluster TaxID=2918883 RepID=A0ABQ5K2F5_9EUKA|nr:hypothetical protein ADUPG1_013135 [Aduncisulcus paluster]
MKLSKDYDSIVAEIDYGMKIQVALAHISQGFYELVRYIYQVPIKEFFLSLAYYFEAYVELERLNGDRSYREAEILELPPDEKSRVDYHVYKRDLLIFSERLVLCIRLFKSLRIIQDKYTNVLLTSKGRPHKGEAEMEFFNFIFLVGVRFVCSLHANDVWKAIEIESHRLFTATFYQKSWSELVGIQKEHTSVKQRRSKLGKALKLRSPISRVPRENDDAIEEMKKALSACLPRCPPHYVFTDADKKELRHSVNEVVREFPESHTTMFPYLLKACGVIPFSSKGIPLSPKKKHIETTTEALFGQDNILPDLCASSLREIKTSEDEED